MCTVRRREKERAKRRAESWGSSGVHVSLCESRCHPRDIREAINVRVGTSGCENVSKPSRCRTIDSFAVNIRYLSFGARGNYSFCGILSPFFFSISIHAVRQKDGVTVGLTKGSYCYIAHGWLYRFSCITFVFYRIETLTSGMHN